MDFDWDDAKNRTNQRKHGLSFSEAAELFTDGRDYLEIIEEDRFIAIGEIRRGIAVVIFTERENDVVRIIGARFATSSEREQFYRYMDQYK